MLYTGQGSSMESNMTVLNLDALDDERNWRSPTGGACRSRGRGHWGRWRQYAAEIPLPFRGLYQRYLRMHQVDILDDQTFGEQLREVIAEPHLVQVHHLYAGMVTQDHVAQHEGRKQG